MKRQILIGKMIIVEPDYKIVHKKKSLKFLRKNKDKTVYKDQEKDLQ